MNDTLDLTMRQLIKPNLNRPTCKVLDWNKPSIDYYKRQGAVDLSEKEGWLSFRMTKNKMEEFVSK